MSAFMCSDKHLLALAVWADSSNDMEKIKQRYYDLWLANCVSLKASYREEVPAEGPDFSVVNLPKVIEMRRLPPLTVLKAAHCYDYQACEDNGYHDSLGFRWSSWAATAAARALPGYDKAPWGL